MPDMNQNRAPERREPQPQNGGQRQASRSKARKPRRRRPIWLTVIVRFFQIDRKSVV